MMDDNGGHVVDGQDALEAARDGYHPILYQNSDYPFPYGRYHVGNIYFQNESLMQAYLKAKAYLVAHSKLAAEIFAYLEKGDYALNKKAGVNLRIQVYDGRSHWDGTWTASHDPDPKSVNVMWDPSMAIETANGYFHLGQKGELSPAMALLHELGHVMGAMQDIPGIKELQSRSIEAVVKGWGKMDEKRVVEQIENVVARDINGSLKTGETREAIRDNHWGDPYITDGVSSHTKVKKYP
jgi:hypothetical protein